MQDNTYQLIRHCQVSAKKKSPSPSLNKQMEFPFIIISLISGSIVYISLKGDAFEVYKSWGKYIILGLSHITMSLNCFLGCY